MPKTGKAQGKRQRKRESEKKAKESLLLFSFPFRLHFVHPHTQILSLSVPFRSFVCLFGPIPPSPISEASPHTPPPDLMCTKWMYKWMNVWNEGRRCGDLYFIRPSCLRDWCVVVEVDVVHPNGEMLFYLANFGVGSAFVLLNMSPRYTPFIGGVTKPPFIHISCMSSFFF